MSEESKTIEFILHPDELSLKGRNQKSFEKDLFTNIRSMLKREKIEPFKLQPQIGRYFISIPEQFESQFVENISKIFGISNFSRCYKFERDLESFKEKILDLIPDDTPSPMNIKVSRVDKTYPIQSPDFSKQIGQFLKEKKGLEPVYKNEKSEIRIEILKDTFVFYSNRMPAAKGLPISSSGRVVSLLSGGFDSPVAAWMMMRRGCSVFLLHFHSQPFGEWRSSISKVRKIVIQLQKWGGPHLFTAVPIGNLQKDIITKCPERLRVTLYRRLMVRVGKMFADKFKCGALSTGDSLGQVASQTIDSMTTIEESIKPMLILRPLLGFTKEEIMSKAKEIGTLELSALEGGDCCAHMLPKNVATKPSIKDAIEAEKTLSIEEMLKSAFEAAQNIDVNAEWNDEGGEGEACPFVFQE